MDRFDYDFAYEEMTDIEIPYINVLTIYGMEHRDFSY